MKSSPDTIENMMGTVRRVTRNVKHWSSSSMALRWTAAAMNEAKKGFRRLKAYKQLPALRSRLPLTTKRKQTIALLSKLRRPLNVIHGNDRFTKFNKARGNSQLQQRDQSLLLRAAGGYAAGQIDTLQKHLDTAKSRVWRLIG